MFSNLLPETVPVYEIIFKNVVEPQRPQMTIRQSVARYISTATRVQAHARARAPTQISSYHREHKPGASYYRLVNTT